MTEHHQEPNGAAPPGPEAAAGPAALAHEALRLVSSVRDWADSAGRDWADSAGGRTAREPVVHTSDCQWCPLCQFAAMLRGERPELTSRVAEAGTAVVAALRALVEAAAETGVGGHGSSHAGRAGQGGPGGQHRHRDPAQQARVQRIDLSGES